MSDPAAADRLEELSESRATGEIRRIYAEIRRLSAVPMVALIYRHLATIPGVLEWGWSLLEPLMRPGALQRQAWALAERVEVPGTPRIPRAALRAAGLGAEDERGIAAVLDAYNRANPVNILAVRCLALHLNGDVRAAATVPAGAWEPPSAPGAIPPMIDPQVMTTPVRELAMLLTDRGMADTPSPLWPSLYRHLANWPAFLGYASVIVPPRFDAVDVAAATLRRGIDAAARELAGAMRAPPGVPTPGASECERLRSAIDRFSERIPEMVVIGAMLRRALP